MYSFYYLYERYEWNNGVCRVTGRYWKYIDTDPDGDDNYTDEHGNKLTITWLMVFNRNYDRC